MARAVLRDPALAAWRRGWCARWLALPDPARRRIVRALGTPDPTAPA